MKNEILLADVVERGDELETLRTLRNRLASAIDESNSGRDIAALSRQLRDCIERIKLLEEERKNEDNEFCDVISRHAHQVVRKKRS